MAAILVGSLTRRNLVRLCRVYLGSLWYSCTSMYAAACASLALRLLLIPNCLELWCCQNRSNARRLQFKMKISTSLVSYSFLSLRLRLSDRLSGFAGIPSCSCIGNYRATLLDSSAVGASQADTPRLPRMGWMVLHPGVVHLLCCHSSPPARPSTAAGERVQD